MCKGCALTNIQSIMKKNIIFLLILLSTNLYSQNEELTIQLNDSTSLMLIRSDFIIEDRQIEFWDERKDAISLIDNELVYGTDATIPKYELKKAVLKIGDAEIELNTVGMYDPWFDNKKPNCRFRITRFLSNPFRLRGSLSIGAGQYFVEWSIINNKAFRTLISHDTNSIVEEEFFK